MIDIWIVIVLQEFAEFYNNLKLEAAAKGDEESRRSGTPRELIRSNSVQEELSLTTF